MGRAVIESGNIYYGTFKCQALGLVVGIQRWIRSSPFIPRSLWPWCQDRRVQGHSHCSKHSHRETQVFRKHWEERVTQETLHQAGTVGLGY